MLQMNVVKWFSTNVNLTFEKNAYQFESCNYKFEENIGVVKEKLSSDIDNLLPEFSIVDNMHQIEKLRENFVLLNNFNEKLSSIEKYVAWINKEQRLLKLERSVFPQICLIQNYLVPFTKLIR